MRIGINLLYLIPGIVGGTETYAAGLLRGLAEFDTTNEYFVFVNREAADWPLPESAGFTRVVCPVAAASRARRYLFEQMYLPQRLKRHAVDLVHSPGYVAPLFPPCPSVVTVHDLNYHAFAGLMPPAKRAALGFFVRQSARRADHVITISRFGCDQVQRVLGVPETKITVTHEAAWAGSAPAAPAADVLRTYGIAGPYLVAFSSRSPHKNIPRLLEAFARLRLDHHLPHRLVLLGHRPAGFAAADPGLPGVIATGYVDAASRDALLKGAELLVFPSTYEGFGLPVLEAQQAGVPVACSNAASLPEVAGEGAVFFDPLSVEQMADAIRRCVSDPGFGDGLRRRGRANVRRFSWEQTARATLGVYAKVAHGRRRR